MNQAVAEPLVADAAPAPAHEAAHGGQQHPIRIYLWIWLLLFVLSACSYMVDYFQLQGALRWTLILAFMLLKAGLHLDQDGELSDGDRVVATILKAGVGPDGQVNGAPTAIFRSRTPPEKHVRAAASGVYGAILKNTRIFSTFDPVQQAPLGGSQLCCVIRAG